MNVRHLVSSVNRRLLAIGSLMLAAGLQQPVHASGVDLSKFRRIEPQYIAALGDPRATSGTGAQSWGYWSQDPGPRGCKLDRYDQLKAAGGVAPAQWKFDAADWWLEEHGLIMEKPTFPLPPGKYLVTGDRTVTSVLTIHPRDKDGNQRWELADGATLYDVTHLVCRLLLEKKKSERVSDRDRPQGRRAGAHVLPLRRQPRHRSLHRIAKDRRPARQGEDRGGDGRCPSGRRLAAVVHARSRERHRGARRLLDRRPPAMH